MDRFARNILIIVGVVAIGFLIGCQEESLVNSSVGLDATSGTIAMNSVELDPEFGQFTIPLSFGFIGGREVHIREESMCNGSAGINIRWNKAENKVKLFGKFDGLPYRIDAKYDYPVSTPYNHYPLGVKDGKWQIWIAGHMGTKISTFYYSSDSTLLGSEFDIEAPEDAISRELVTFQAICTPLFESNPHTLQAEIAFEFDYDAMLDPIGSGGMYVAFAPTVLDDLSSQMIYYTDGGLPVSEAMNFEDIIADINAGGGLVLSTSLEPDPKPAYLHARDNLMIGWGGDYPAGSASWMGLPVDMTAYGDCGTFQLPDPF